MPALLLLPFRLMRWWVAVVAGYLVGSILTADVAAGLAGRRSGGAVDLRAAGSGNPGAANAMANLGTGWGIAVLAGDIAKGALASAIGRRIAGDAGAYGAGTAAVVGHCYPAWANFRGGKGVATSAGTTLVCFPAYVPIDIALVAASWAASRHAMKATLAASAVFVVAAWAWHRLRLRNAWGPKPTAGLPLFALATSALIAWKFLSAPAHMGDRPRQAGLAPPADSVAAARG